MLQHGNETVPFSRCGEETQCSGVRMVMAVIQYISRIRLHPRSCYVAPKALFFANENIFLLQHDMSGAKHEYGSGK